MLNTHNMTTTTRAKANMLYHPVTRGGNRKRTRHINTMMKGTPP
jgi:hypothetical protein